MRTRSALKYVQSAPYRRQMEQLQETRTRGRLGSVSLTAPQWHVPRNTVALVAGERRAEGERVAMQSS